VEWQKANDFMVPAEGFEPPTNGLQIQQAKYAYCAFNPENVMELE
jgi:hypothetical protein